MNVAYFMDCLPSIEEALGSFPIPQSTRLGANAGNSSTWKVEAGKSEIQGQPQLHGESENKAGE